MRSPNPTQESGTWTSAAGPHKEKRKIPTRGTKGKVRRKTHCLEGEVTSYRSCFCPKQDSSPVQRWEALQLCPSSPVSKTDRWVITCSPNGTVVCMPFRHLVGRGRRTRHSRPSLASYQEFKALTSPAPPKSQAWWPKPLIPPLGRWTREDEVSSLAP